MSDLVSVVSSQFIALSATLRICGRLSLNIVDGEDLWQTAFKFCENMLAAKIS